MRKDLTHISGLPIALDIENAAIHFNADLGGQQSQRTAQEMREFISQFEAVPSRDPIYTVFRQVAQKEDAPRIKAAGLRYDLTLIPPGTFAHPARQEFFRTAGHYHKKNPGRDLNFPEVYEVLSGRAYWIIQRPAEKNPAILEEVYAVEAGPGEKAIMLPGFGHLSVNAFDEPLLMANWIATAVGYDYAPFARFRGAGYWVTTGGLAQTIEFERNPNYQQVAGLEKLRPKALPEFGLTSTAPLYGLSRHIEKLEFLDQPERFKAHLTIDHCFSRAV